jgi:hypothetical protein
MEEGKYLFSKWKIDEYSKEKKSNQPAQNGKWKIPDMCTSLQIEQLQRDKNMSVESQKNLSA